MKMSRTLAFVLRVESLRVLIIRALKVLELRLLSKRAYERAHKHTINKDATNIVVIMLEMERERDSENLGARIA